MGGNVCLLVLETEVLIILDPVNPPQPGTQHSQETESVEVLCITSSPHVVTLKGQESEAVN